MTEYDFPTAFKSWGREESAAIKRVIKSDRYTMGREVEAFEEEFAAYHSMKHAIMVNSGSSANLLAVAALHVKMDKPLGCNDPIPDYAMVPAVAWSTTYAPLVQHGVKIRLVDVDNTWNAPCADWHPPVCRVIIACSILGNPGYLAEWKAKADKLGAYFIEDNCESFGAITPEGKLCGTHGIMNTFSIFHSHQISGIEGGLVLTDDDECAALCRILRAHGWTRDTNKPECFEDEYDFIHFGYNIRPLEMHAAIAREQLKKTSTFRAERFANFVVFENLTAGLPITQPSFRGAINPFGLHFLCESQEARARLVPALRANNVDCRLPTGGSARVHNYGKQWRDQKTPHADDIHHRGIFLGNAPFALDKKIEKAVKIMKGVL